MKKALLLILIVIGLTSCKAQELDGIWMSYRNYVVDINSMYTSGNEGIIINFEKESIGSIHNDSIIPVIFDFKESKLFVKNDTLNVGFKVYAKDSIEIDFGGNMMQVFRPLNLNHKLTFDKSQFRDFLINNSFEKIDGSIEFEFSNKFFFRDQIFEKPNKKNAYH